MFLLFTVLYVKTTHTVSCLDQGVYKDRSHPQFNSHMLVNNFHTTEVVAQIPYCGDVTSSKKACYVTSHNETSVNKKNCYRIKMTYLRSTSEGSNQRN